VDKDDKLIYESWRDKFPKVDAETIQQHSTIRKTPSELGVGLDTAGAKSLFTQDISKVRRIIDYRRKRNKLPREVWDNIIDEIYDVIELSKKNIKDI